MALGRFPPPLWPIRLLRELTGGGRPATCKGCGQPILWAQTAKRGRWTPNNPDGSSHWDTCTHPGRFRKARST